MAKRCVAYGRVSTNQEKQKTSIQSQMAYYTEKFKGDGFAPSPYGMIYKKDGTIEPLSGMYVDEGISGTSLNNRKAFERMLSDAKQGKFEVIYVKSVSRFARNTVDGLQTIRDLKRLGIRVIFEDWSSINTLEDDEAMLTIAFMQAQNESEIKSRNVKFGIRQRQRSGKWFCNAHFGYDKVEGGLVINPQEAKTVQLIFRLYTEEDYSVHAIVQYLNKHIEEYPTKKNKLWNRTQVGGLLDNSIYVGLYRSHVEEKQGWMATDDTAKVPEAEQFIHELPELQIISNDTWDRSVQIRKAREARYSTVEIRGRNTNQHLLSTILFCKECGTSYVRCKRHGGLRKDGSRKDLGYFWVCRDYNLYGKARCTNKYGINEDEAEEQVKEEIQRLQRDIAERDGGALKTNFKAYLRVMYELDHETEDIEAVKSQLKKIQKKQEILLDDRAEGILSVDLYREQVKALNEEREELEQRLKANSMYEDTVAREWVRYEKYTKRILALDTENLSNGDIKQVFNKIYVGAVVPEGRKRPQKYLIFSYSIMGYSVEELIDMFREKGYTGEIKITVNGQ